MLFFAFLFKYISPTSPIYKNSINRAKFLQINQSECFYDHHYTNRSFFYCTVCFIGCTFESIQTHSEGGAISLLIQTTFTTNNYFENCNFSHCTGEEGGAIYMKIEKECKTEIKNCTFTKCIADLSGGSLLFFIREHCNVDIINSTFDQNTASQKLGGSIRASSNPISDFKFQNCSFKFNKAFKEGGAIFLYTLKATFYNCIFYNNTAEIEGGSILTYYSICSYFMCLFDKNEATKLKNPNSNDDKDFTYGGAVSIRFGTNSHDNKVIFDKCNFTNNVVYSDIKECVGGGGAVSLFEAEPFLAKCNFINNEVDSYESNGGAVKYSCLYGIISECKFVNNKLCLGKGQGDGGAIEVKENDFYYVNYIIKKQYNVTIKQCNFINNKIESNNKIFSGGGAVSFKHLFAIFFENNFVNNSVCTYSGSQGGAVYFKDVYGQIDSCNFTFNYVEINSSSIDNYQVPRSFGGAFYMSISRSYFNKCLFINNTGSGVGGAVYSSSSVKFTECSFINNSVINYLSESDLNTIIRGGACYFASSTELINIYFINNTVTVRLYENSCHINVNAYGGAVYAKYSYVLCSNCSFLRNLVFVPNNHQNEFAGAIELNKGKIENCTFIDNVAYNGCNIGYSQLSYNVYNINSNISINNNFFMYNSLNDHNINSIIYIDVNSTHNPINTFAKVILYKSAVLFDGKIVENKNPNPYITVHFIPRFIFNNNCMTPFNQKFFISDDFVIYNEVENKNISFEFAFVSTCDGYESQIPITQTPITQIPTNQISNNDNNNKTDIETSMLSKIYALLSVITVFQIVIVIIILFVIFLLRRRNDRDDIDPLIA